MKRCWSNEFDPTVLIKQGQIHLTLDGGMGGLPASSYVGGFRVRPGITGITGTDYDTSLLDLDGTTIDGNSPIYETFTAPAVIYPIFTITLSALSGKTWRASEGARPWRSDK